MGTGRDEGGEGAEEWMAEERKRGKNGPSHCATYSLICETTLPYTFTPARGVGGGGNEERT